MQLYTVYFISKLLYIFRVASPPIIRSTNNCIYSIWYWSTVVAMFHYRGAVETAVSTLPRYRPVATTFDQYQKL